MQITVGNSNGHKRSPNVEDVLARIDMATLLVDMGFDDVDPDAEEQLLFCIFHNDVNTKSFSVNLEKKVFRCFSSNCPARGSAITLYAMWKQIPWEQALTELQYLPKRRSVATLKKKLAARKSLISVSRRMQIMTEFIDSLPPLSESKYAPVLESRGITLEAQDYFQLKAYDDTITQPYEELFQAGVANVWHNPVFQNHPILMPYYLGESVAFIQGRQAVKDDTRSKYMGTRGMIPCMFNHSILRHSPKRVFMTEGALDAISMECMGYGPALGVVGSDGFKEEWAGEFKGVDEVWIATDNDASGQEAFFDWAKKLQKAVSVVRKFTIPAQYKDANEWLIATNNEKA